MDAAVDVSVKPSIFEQFVTQYKEKVPEEMSLEAYLDLCKEDPTAYHTAAERLLAAIGEPTSVDTSKNERLRRIFENRTIQVYDSFGDFFGMEEAIMDIVKHIRHAAQGLEESKQILYLLGPVGGGKSSLADRLKKLVEKRPIYALKFGDEIAPMHENPLSLFAADDYGAALEETYGIPKRYIRTIKSPWMVKRLKEANGDLSKFTVVKLYPSIEQQVAISSTEPGDENNQDISTLVGKVDINKLEHFSESDADAYAYSGALNLANRGVMEFIEMFKAPIKVLNPLLEATQSRRFNGSQPIGAMPFNGMVLAHSNESEWAKFRNNPTNEAFIARTNLVQVPYCLRVDEEREIYAKLIRESALVEAPCAPETLEILAKFAILTRLKEHKNSDIFTKMRVYNGENVRAELPNAKSISEYREAAGQDEGMAGYDTRSAFKVLSKVFNYEAGEVAANPVHLFHILEKEIKKMRLTKEQETRWLGFIREKLVPDYISKIGKQIQTAYLESYAEYGQNLFDRYVTFADHWIQDQDWRDPATGQIYERKALEVELLKLEKPAGISNPKDFRNEVVNFCLRHRAEHAGRNPEWTAYEKLRSVIEKGMFANTEELLPVISYGAKSSADQDEKHADYVTRMVERGYTEKQVRLVTEWWIRNRAEQRAATLG